MKLPKTFIPKKKQNINRLLKPKEEKADEFALETILESLNNYIKYKDIFASLHNQYETCKKIIENLVNVEKTSYSKKEIEELSKDITIDDLTQHMAGIYFSALVNKIITDNEIITLNFEKQLSGLGVYLPKGTLIIQGDAGNHTGNSMTGGKIIVKGNAGDYTGCWMKDGEIHVEGEIKSVAKLCEGKVYQKGRRKYPR